MSIDGILNVLKPPGKTSFQIVSLVRKLSAERRVGHAGTLDPYATGVLPVCLGQGTRVIEFMVDASKTYRTEIQIGATTDTYDATGKVLKTHDPSCVTQEQLGAVLDSFHGTIHQIPPMYSAIKHQGQPLYRLARQGIEVPRKSREVHIYDLRLVEEHLPSFTIEVECSSGTYIRSLAHDIGQKLGCGAFVKELARLRCGPFEIDQAVPLTSLEEAFQGGYWKNFLHPIDEVLMDWPAVIVDAEDEQLIKNGRSVSLEGVSKPENTQKQCGNWCRAYSKDGYLLAALQCQPDSDLWHPFKVFHNPQGDRGDMSRAQRPQCTSEGN